MIGYKLKRTDCDGWLFLGTKPREVGIVFAEELQSNDGLSPEEIGGYLIEPFVITPEEIENMPEFDGW